jgi:cobalamin biosynthesis protein CbiG
MRALEAGLERKLLSIFGIDSDKAIAEAREKAIAKDKVMSRARNERARTGTHSPDEPGAVTTTAYAARDPAVIEAQKRRRAERTGIDVRPRAEREKL